MRSRNKYSGKTQTSRNGRILNRVIEWDRDGITTEADQRHVRQKMKSLELERANHSASPRAVERRVESKGEHGCGRGQIKGRWNDDDSGDPHQMADDDAMDSQALTGGDITRYRAPVARISYLSQDRPDLKFASMRVERWQYHRCWTWNCVKRIGRLLVGKSRAKCWIRWQQKGEMEAHSDADWGGGGGGDRAIRRSVSVGVIMSGSQQVVAL